jgi:hypothetical protein
MDSSISIKPPPAALSKTLAARDPVTVREAVATDLDHAKAVSPSGDGASQQHDQRSGQQQGDHPAHEHPPQDVLVDAESRELIYRERDVRAAERAHPDQALLRQRAYQPAPADKAPQPPLDPHADLKA